MSIDTEQVTVTQVVALVKTLGLGAMICDFAKVDYTRGRGILEGDDRCLWTTDGKRITISLTSDGGMITSQTREPDPDMPPAVYEAQNIFMRKCIKPGCVTEIDIRKKKSGACCKQHMSYECTHPDCVKKAEKNGWDKYTHPYGTRIANLHLKYAREN